MKKILTVLAILGAAGGGITFLVLRPDWIVPVVFVCVFLLPMLLFIHLILHADCGDFNVTLFG